MKYRSLGRSDLTVSAICLGSMTWGEQNDLSQAMAQLDYAFANGVNFIDVAEMYPVPPRAETQGASERMIGEWLQARNNRSSVVLATKVVGRGERNPGANHIRSGPRLTPEHIQQACDDSLRRLRTDYIDLYQVHWPERHTNFFGRLDYSVNAQHDSASDGVPIGETLEALEDLVRAGKVRYLGISNESPWGLMQYVLAASERGCSRIVSIQNPYNLLNRSFDIGLAEIALREQVSLLAYSPLAFGTLSGKYLAGAKPEGARLSLFERFQRYDSAEAKAAVADYVALAHAHNLDPAQMALAWVNSRQTLGANIVGATTLAQLRSNIDSIHLHLADDVLAGIDAIHRRYPNPAP